MAWLYMPRIRYEPCELPRAPSAVALDCNGALPLVPTRCAIATVPHIAPAGRRAGQQRPVQSAQATARARGSRPAGRRRDGIEVAGGCSSSVVSSWRVAVAVGGWGRPRHACACQPQPHSCCGWAVRATCRKPQPAGRWNGPTAQPSINLFTAINNHQSNSPWFSFL